MAITYAMKYGVQLACGVKGSEDADDEPAQESRATPHPQRRQNTRPSGSQAGRPHQPSGGTAVKPEGIDWELFGPRLNAALETRVRGLGDVEVAIGMKPTMRNIEDYMLKNDLPSLLTLMAHLDEKWSADSIETARLAELDGMPDEEKASH